MLCHADGFSIGIPMDTPLKNQGEQTSTNTRAFFGYP